MPVFLNNDDDFLSPESADEDGIIAVGGDLSSERLLTAYRLGIFPWPHEGLPILWFCPDPRFVLEPAKIVVNRALRKAISRSSLIVKADSDFYSVIKKCSQAGRKDQGGTWITDEMIAAYHELHRLGFAHSVEAYDNHVLVGGLYGISIGSIFFGESMFFDQSNASKICFVTLVGHLLAWGFSLIDCQAHTQNLEKFGAHAIKREEFLKKIQANDQIPTMTGPWNFQLSPKEALQKIRTYS